MLRKAERHLALRLLPTTAAFGNLWGSRSLASLKRAMLTPTNLHSILKRLVVNERKVNE